MSRGRWLLLPLFLSACDAVKEADRDPQPEAEAEEQSSKKSKKKSTGVASATSIPSPPAPPIGPFVRTLPPQAERAGTDACAYLGGLGFACLDALIAETDPVKRAYMRRLSDADAALSRDEVGGVAHAEVAMQCGDSGPCGAGGTAGMTMDDGFACLTKAEMAKQAGDKAAVTRAHARACTCDTKRAVIPVMGGTLACDGDKPVDRSADLPLAEAKDVRACGTCEATSGPAACQREIERLDKKDPQVAVYLRTNHVPRCQGGPAATGGPTPVPAPPTTVEAKPAAACVPCASQEDFDAAGKQRQTCCPTRRCENDAQCTGGRVCCKFPGGTLCADAARCSNANRVGTARP